MEEPKKPRGRPRKSQDEKLVRLTCFFAPAEAEKIERNGADWHRAVVRRAKDKPKASGENPGK